MCPVHQGAQIPSDAERHGVKAVVHAAAVAHSEIQIASRTVTNADVHAIVPVQAGSAERLRLLFVNAVMLPGSPYGLSAVAETAEDSLYAPRRSAVKRASRRNSA